MPAVKYFKAQCCPDQERCSDASWDRAKVWGYTEEEARQKLKEHLENSSKHNQNLEPEEIEVMVQSAEVVEAEWAQPVAKKSRMSSPDKQAAASAAATEIAAAATRSAVQSIVGELFAGGSAVKPLLAASCKALSLPPVEKRGIATVTVRTEVIKHVVDALDRAHTAARHAQRLSQAAASAFSSEAEIMMETKQVLAALLQ